MVRTRSASPSKRSSSDATASIIPPKKKTKSTASNKPKTPTKKAKTSEKRPPTPRKARARSTKSVAESSSPKPRRTRASPKAARKSESTKSASASPKRSPKSPSSASRLTEDAAPKSASASPKRSSKSSSSATSLTGKDVRRTSLERMDAECQEEYGSSFRFAGSGPDHCSNDSSILKMQRDELHENMRLSREHSLKLRKKLSEFEAAYRKTQAKMQVYAEENRGDAAAVARRMKTLENYCAETITTVNKLLSHPEMCESKKEIDKFSIGCFDVDVLRDIISGMLDAQDFLEHLLTLLTAADRKFTLDFRMTTSRVWQKIKAASDSSKVKDAVTVAIAWAGMHIQRHIWKYAVAQVFWILLQTLLPPVVLVKRATQIAEATQRVCGLAQVVFKLLRAPIFVFAAIQFALQIPGVSDLVKSYASGLAKKYHKDADKDLRNAKDRFTAKMKEKGARNVDIIDQFLAVANDMEEETKGLMKVMMTGGIWLMLFFTNPMVSATGTVTQKICGLSTSLIDFIGGLWPFGRNKDTDEIAENLTLGLEDVPTGPIGRISLLIADDSVVQDFSNDLVGLMSKSEAFHTVNSDSTVFNHDALMTVQKRFLTAASNKKYDMLKDKGIGQAYIKAGREFVEKTEALENVHKPYLKKMKEMSMFNPKYYSGSAYYWWYGDDIAPNQVKLETEAVKDATEELNKTLAVFVRQKVRADNSQFWTCAVVMIIMILTMIIAYVVYKSWAKHDINPFLLDPVDPEEVQKLFKTSLADLRRRRDRLHKCMLNEGLIDCDVIPPLK
ncbi:hypothetical protein JKP88DRAFT_250735 [Tribonema minus]|uniref:Transmembrane protein n=1 Tax=Tribonema minus TaxID=303371 RepID=A0A836CR46_9STRA|nr:hypothetical protein JKP88DRAFT_250735 [Tribonema minus]